MIEAGNYSYRLDLGTAGDDLNIVLRPARDAMARAAKDSLGL